MAKQTGFLRYMCDRCHATAYLQDNDPHKGDWHEITHVTADSTQNTYLLCSSCWLSWRALALTQDTDFSKYMTNTEDKD